MQLLLGAATWQLNQSLAALSPHAPLLLRVPDVQAALERVALKCATFGALALATEPGRVQLVRRAPRRLRRCASQAVRIMHDAFCHLTACRDVHLQTVRRLCRG